jgi:hypothetical protein
VLGNLELCGKHVMNRYEILGYVETKRIGGAVFLTREYAPGRYCGQVILETGRVVVMQSPDVDRLLSKGEVIMAKYYTKEELLNMSEAERTAIYNKVTGQAVKRARKTQSVVNTILAAKPVKTKKKVETVSSQGIDNSAALLKIREMLLTGKAYTLDDFKKATDSATGTVRAKLSRLKSAKYVEQPINIKREGNTYSCV